jgi:hypothetical protein
VKRARMRLANAAREAGRHATERAIIRWLWVELPGELEGRAETARLLGKNAEAKELRQFAYHAAEIGARLRRGEHWGDLQMGALRELRESMRDGGEE